MWPNPEETAYLVTFTPEILNENLIFCVVWWTLDTTPKQRDKFICSNLNRYKPNWKSLSEKEQRKNTWLKSNWGPTFCGIMAEVWFKNLSIFVELCN